MPNERSIPTQAAPSVVTLTVLSDGNAVPAVHQLLSVVVSHELNRIPAATLVFRDGDPAAQTFESSNTKLFVPGAEIEVKAGYRAQEDTIFKGVVVKHGLKIRDQRSTLVVECRDETYKMSIKPKSRYFRDQTDSEMIEDIIRENGLGSAVESTSLRYGEVIQFDATDWDFIMMRAEMNGLLCTVEDGQLTIKPPDYQQAPALTLQYGATIMEFDAEMDARNQFESVQSVAWDAAEQAIVEGESGTAAVVEAGNITSGQLAKVHGSSPYQQYHTGGLSSAELTNWSAAKLLKSKMAKITGRVKFQGTQAIKVGQLLKLQGVGERFEGNVLVSGLRHQVANGNWTIDAQIGLSPEWFSERYEVHAPQAAGLVPAVSGLQIGVVTQLQDDPEGAFRIMVRLPTVNAEEEGTWARLSAFDAGDSRGAFFLPEIGDEVVVGFLNNDPRQAIVLGALHSSAKPAPLEAADDNHEKGIVTRSGIRLIFDDDKKDVLLETPDGHRLLLSGENQAIELEDASGNKLVMDGGGVTIESAADITFKATGNFTAEGVNVEAKASASATLEGSATTTVKGGLVQIN